MSNGAETTTTIAADATFNGRLVGQDVTVQGTLEGEVQIKGVLRVGERGRVRANIQAGTVEIRGEFDGEVHAGTLIFAETARAKGTFVSEKLSIREGALVDGALKTDRGAAVPKG